MSSAGCLFLTVYLGLFGLQAQEAKKPATETSPATAQADKKPEPSPQSGMGEAEYKIRPSG